MRERHTAYEQERISRESADKRLTTDVVRMSLQDGLPWRWILRWTYERLLREPGFCHVRIDEAMEQIFFTVRVGGRIGTALQTEHRARLAEDRPRGRAGRVDLLI